jgi:hypothetical protein
MFPVPRTAMPSRWLTQTTTEPPSAALGVGERVNERFVASARPQEREGRAYSGEDRGDRERQEQGWKTRASARSLRPAPSAQATADETPANLICQLRLPRRRML